MDCYPADIEHKLGFDIVRARIADLADTELGRARVEQLSPLADRKEVENRLDQIGEWAATIDSGEQTGLGPVPDLHDVLVRVSPAGSWVTPEEAMEVVDALRTARLVGAFFSSRTSTYPACANLAGALEPDRELETKIDDLFDDSGGIRDDASPELRRIRKQIRAAEDRLRRAAARALGEAQSAGFAAADEPTIRGGRIVIPIKAEAKRKLDGLVVDTSATGQTVFVEPEECIEYNNELRLLEGQERREIIRILEQITDEIRLRRAPLEQNQRVLTEFDVIRACTRLGRELHAVRPDIADDETVDIRAGRNVALTLVRMKSRASASNLEIVPLDLSLGGDLRVLLISGPNAGGKSVALKSVGLFAMMLAYGLPIPAEEGTKLPLFRRLFVDIGDEQSIETDLSTFSSHLQRLKHIVESSDGHSLVLIDELGTATDPSAGAAIAQAVMEHLLQAGATAIVTTHFGALKAFADETEGVINGAMMFNRDTLSPTYVFEPGVPGSSFAFEIAQRTDFPQVVLDRARQLVGSQESSLEDLLAELEAAKRRLAEEERVLRERLTEAQAAEKDAREARDRIAETRDSILAKAEHDADALLKEANRTIERTVREIREAQAERKKTMEAREHVSELRASIEKRAKTRKQRLPKKKDPEQKATPIQPGDQVVLDEGQTVGEVRSVKEDSAAVTFGSIQTRVDVARLKKVGGPKKQKVEVGRVASGAEDRGTLAEARQRIDVRGYHVAEAIPEVEKLIDQAVRVGLRRLEVLHGTGTGTLRAALREHLSAMSDVSDVKDAPLEQGGPGISIVTLR